MPFPDGLTVVTVRCKFDGLARVRFEARYPLQGPSDNSIVRPFAEAKETDADGLTTFELPANNDPLWTPVDWPYDVVVSSEQGTFRGTAQFDYQDLTPELADVFQPDGAAVPGVTYATLAQLEALADTVPTLPIAIGDVTGLQTALDGKQPTGSYLVAADIDDLATEQALTDGLATKLDALDGQVVDSTLVVRKGDLSAGLRLRSTGGAVDIDKTSGDVYVSSFAGPGFSGAQTGIQRWRAAGTTLAGLTEFGSTADLSEQSIDGAGGVANLGAKNGATNLGLAGYLDIPRAPTSGTWAAGEIVMTRTGLYRCVSGGTPGTWVSMSPVDPLPTPFDHGLIGWTFDPQDQQAGTAVPTAGLAHVVRIKLLSSVLTNLHFHLTVGGSVLTANQCYATVHNDAGAKIGADAITGSLHNTGAGGWGDSGAKVCPLVTPQGGITPGAWYKIAFWWNGSGGPSFSRNTNAGSSMLNINLTAGTARYATANAGLTTAASAPENLGATSGGSTAWWVGAS
jgi:hypothetical protein